ncbi:hypothetical protein [Brevibacillus brevis]|uniref:hypothetical protein n=1 Tax=Brevibacillus brevis TaxID=1393 RepID=UPI001C8EBA8D|nr:hypothetical protein [Brevibacillus brevis]MBY0085761.1 hypothetical protein [Brevibacillus brevis]
MKKYWLLIVVIIISILPIKLAFAEGLEKQVTTGNQVVGLEKQATTSKSNEAVQNVVPKTEKKLDEAEAYKLLYENAKSFNEKLLSTIYWALGGMITVIVAFIGINIFFNDRSKKNEAETLLKQFQASLKEYESLSTVNIESKMSTFFDNSKQEMLTYLKQLTEAQLDQLKTMLETQKINMESIHNENIQAKAANSEKIQSLEKLIQMSSLRIEVALSKLEGDVWRLKGIENNTFSCYVKSAQSSILLGVNMEYPLKFIIESLEKMTYMASHDVRTTARLLDDVSEEYAIQKRHISDLVQKLPIK